MRKILSCATVILTVSSHAGEAAELKLGIYACNVVRMRMNGQGPSYEYQGYFELLPGNRYRWLDNGPVGNYKFDPASNTVTWLSGHLASAPNKTVLRTDWKAVVIDWKTPNGDYSWNCGFPS